MNIHCYRLPETGHALRKNKLRPVYEKSINHAVIGLHPSAVGEELLIILYDGIDIEDYLPTVMQYHTSPVLVVRCDATPQLLNRPR